MDQHTMLLIITALFSVLFWLLQMKDSKQAKQIDLLFEKHDADAEKLQALELRIAQQHYDKRELDVKFDKLERTFSEGFFTLSESVENVRTLLVQYLTRDERS